MIDSSSVSPCVKCGRPVPTGAGFCPNCGTQLTAPTFTAPGLANADVVATMHLLAGSGGGTLEQTPPSPTIGSTDAPTIGPTGAVTSLDHPSPPVSRPGDGPFSPGQQISPRYTILKLLGVGGMGAVYQGFDHELGTAVAIKVIRPAAQADATAARELEQRFKRELVLARQVTHKYVVRIHDLGEIQGVKYLTMPFVEGETLAEAMRRSGRLPLARVITIARQVAQGLAAAHEKGVIHRDLKPENIMIQRAADAPIPDSGDALIMDFGIARSVQPGATQTATGSVIGTLEYMSPEQALARKLDQRSDIYSFGLIVYDMLLGRQRLAGQDSAMAELLARLSTAPPAPREIDPTVPEAVDRLVRHCLHPDPDARFASTQELVNALDHLTPDGQIRSDVHEVVVERKVWPVWQLGAAAVVIVGLAGTAGWLTSNRGPDPGAVAVNTAEAVSVLIADFENKTGDAVFDGVIEQALSLGIEGASFVNAYPRRDALRAAAAINAGSRLDEQTARLVALRESLGMVIVGGIEPKGSGYHITIKGVGPGLDANVRYTLEEDAASKADVLQTVAVLAGNVRAALGDTTAPAAGDAFTAANLEAAREFARGQELFAAGKFDAAIPAYLDALKHDPDFARAYAGAATAANNLGRREEARDHYEKALARIDRLTDREKFRIRGQYYLFSRNAPKAIEELTGLTERYPSDATGLSNLANAHFQLRQFDKAMEMGARVASIYPNNVLRQNNVAFYAMYAGKFEDANARGKKASELNTEYGQAWMSQGLSAAALGKYDDATAAYTQLATIGGWKAAAAQGLADLALLRGRIEAAAAALEPVLSEKLPPLQQARIQTTLASVRLAQGRTAEAIKLAAASVQLSEDPTIRFEAGRILLAAGQAARAKALADELDKALSPETQALGLTLAGEIQLASRNARAAIALFQQSLKLADAWQTRYLLGRAYLDGEAFAEAESELDACVRRRGEATAIYLDDVPTWRMIAPVYYYHGAARAAIRNTSGAAEAFRTFLAFKDGGDEQSALVADARKRLAN